MSDQPAFPNEYSAPKFREGMTLRDYFAAKALAGWLASYGSDSAHPVSTDHAKTVAAFSYAIADAMLAAREK